MGLKACVIFDRGYWRNSHIHAALETPGGQIINYQGRLWVGIKVNTGTALCYWLTGTFSIQCVYIIMQNRESTRDLCGTDYELSERH
jgi:hypothetical protein